MDVEEVVMLVGSLWCCKLRRLPSPYTQQLNWFDLVRQRSLHKLGMLSQSCLISVGWGVRY